jgi:MFS family permease
MQAATRLARRFGTHRVIPAGMLLAAAGMVLLAQVDAHSSYLVGVLPGLVAISFGLGCVTGPAMAAATARLDPGDAGVASAAVNTMQQVGGSLGTALLNTLAVSATAATLAGHPRTPQLVAQAAAHGYTTAFWVSALLLAAGAAVSGTLLAAGVRGRDQAGTPQTAVPAEPVLTH